MACTEARLVANRPHALKTTGPKTEEGTGAPCRKALKHGPTGAGMVIPGEDAEEVARQSAAFLVELAPDGQPTARLLAERVATLAVRLRRSARHEFAATAERDPRCGRHRLRRGPDPPRPSACSGRSMRGRTARSCSRCPRGWTCSTRPWPSCGRSPSRPRATRPAGRATTRRDWPGASAAEARAHAEALGRALDSKATSAGIDAGIVAIMDPDQRARPVGAGSGRRAGRGGAGVPRGGSGRGWTTRPSPARAREAVEPRAGRRRGRRRCWPASTRRPPNGRSIAPSARSARPASRPRHRPPPSNRRRRSPRWPNWSGRPMSCAGIAPGSSRPPSSPRARRWLRFFPGAVEVSASNSGSTIADVKPAPRGQSRFEDRRQRPKLGR